MRIPLPRAPRWFERLIDWINEPIFEHHDIRRIDILLVLVGLIVVIYYGYTSGWRGALLGGVLYVFIAMCALWVL
jgi:hypothetical protein